LPVPADRIIHCFVQEDPIQMRGEPWLATAINVFRKIRRLDDSTLSAMEIATKFAAFLSAQFPELGDNFEALLPSVMDLEDGTLTTLPPGYEPKQVKPEHPGHNVHEFRRDQYAAAGAGSCMPVNAVTGDSSKHNFASARFDGNFMVTDAEFVRGVVESRACDKAFLMWLEEAIAVGQVPTPRAPYYTQYLWPTNDAHTDPTKKQNADRSAAEIGRKTVGDLVIEDGRDDDDHRDRLLEEVEWYRGHGLQHPLDAAAPAGTGKEAADEDGKDGDDEKDDAEK
ncbi:MAG: phage portal protein, partial [Candidatus Shapirobacteria bacterium]